MPSSIKLKKVNQNKSNADNKASLIEVECYDCDKKKNYKNSISND